MKLTPEQLFEVLLMAITCQHDAVDGDICCRCKFRVDFFPDGLGPGEYCYGLSEDQTTGGALAFIEDET